MAGSSIGLESRSLSIASPQDSAVYDGNNYRIEAQVTAGYGFSASGSAEYGNIGADHRSTTLQSGLFAGDGGFQVNIKEHTDLKGGIITSSAKAETEGRNRFQTATLSHSDIENHSRYQGESYGIGMSGSVSGEDLGQSQTLGGVRLYNTGAAGSGGTAGGSPAGYSQSIGFGRDGDSRSSLTKSGIGTSSLTIGNDTTGEQAKAVYTATRTETAEQGSGRLNNTFDQDKVQRELDIQREVTQQFGSNAAYLKSRVNQQIDQLKAQKEAGTISEADYHDKVQKLQYLNVGISSVAGALATPTDSGLGIGAAALNPAGAYAIGQYFKGLEDENGRLGGDKETARVLAHGVLSASVAALGGNDAAAAALSAAGAEAVAPMVSNWLYGTDDPDKLTAEQKNTIAAITSLGGAAVGGYTGGNGVDAMAGYQAARNAIENNLHLRKGERARLRQELNACKKQKGCDSVQIERKWEQKAIDNQKELYAACDKGVATPECNALRNKIDRSTYNGWKDYWYPTGMEFSVSTDAALYAVFGGNVKADVAIGNRGAAAQFEGGLGIGIGAKAKAGKWEREDRGASVSSSAILREKTFGSKPSPDSATLSTKASLEGYLGPVVVGSEVVGGREYPKDSESKVYKNFSTKIEVKTQWGIGGAAKWDFINYRTNKYEKKL